jgi:cell division protein FtsN
MLKVNLAILLSAMLLGGCVYERSEGNWSPNPGPGTADAPPPRYAPPARNASPPPPPPSRMQASVPSDRVSAQDLARLNPGTGVAGPEAEPYRRERERTASLNGRIFVQAASFVTREQAERARRSLAGLGPTGVYTAYVDDQLRYRVRVGPLATPERSERVRAALVRRGYGDAIIVRD